MSDQTADTTSDTAAATSALDAGGTEITWENSPIAQVYNPDGSPKDTAAQALAEMGKEDLAGYALRNGQDIFTALKTGKDATAFASQKLEGVVKLPGEDATDEDRAKFNQALGALDNPEDYLKDIWPEDLPEGFQKDDKLASLLAEHATSNPVLNTESVKGLVGKFIAHQNEQIAEMQKTELEAAQEAANVTKDTLTAEMGGTVQFEQFAKSAKEAMTSTEFQQFGFEFKPDENGKLSTDNPLHAALLNDPAFLRLLKSNIDAKAPAGIPSGQVHAQSQQDNDAKARELYENFGVGGWKDSAKMNEYYRLKGITP